MCDTCGCNVTEDNFHLLHEMPAHGGAIDVLQKLPTANDHQAQHDRDDKPAKYPVMFRAADVVLLSKCDLLAILDDFEPARAESALRALGRDTPMIRVAARRQPDIGDWLAWLRTELLGRRRQQVQRTHAHPLASLPA
jgi:G3E family GTPase